MNAYFISDLHLKSEDSSSAKVFLNFLSTIQSNATHLILLGDIFDLWIGDHFYFQRKYPQIIEKIKKLVLMGVEVHYFEGNHDLHLKKFWQDTVGVKVHSEFKIFYWEDKIIRAEHGDLMNPEDTGYLFLRKFLRSKPMTFLAHHLPGKIIGVIGDQSSRVSRTYTAKKISEHKVVVENRTREYAQKIYDQTPFDLFVCGHTHVDEDCCFQKNQKEIRCINLGSWLDHPKYLLVTPNKTQLHSLTLCIPKR